MEDILVRNEKSNYKVYIQNTMDNMAVVLKENKIKNTDKLFLITDSKVSIIYNVEIKKLSQEHNCTVHRVPQGEENKNYNTIEGIYKFLLENNADRDSVLIALGGGVVGDLVGFVAATFMRGIRFINIPTTLLSQVDSCIGGKVGYNFSSVKNAIGAFYNPIFVYVAVDFLKSLDEAQYIDGLGEVVKYGLISKNTLLQFLKENYNYILVRDSEKLACIIRKCLSIKADIIEKDYSDTNYRNILNFGHSIGHAIETVSQYKIGHGSAVALGMLAAINLSIKFFNVQYKLYDDMEELFLKLGIPTRYNIDNYHVFLYSISHDKKNSDNMINMVLLQELGQCNIKVPVSNEAIIRAFEESVGRK